MQFNESWDDDSKKEFLAWIASAARTPQEKIACAELWAIMTKEILFNGPIEITDHRPFVRSDGKSVEIYRIKRRSKVVMLFGVYEASETQSYVHLVLIAPINYSRMWAISKDRIERWTI